MTLVADCAIILADPHSQVTDMKYVYVAVSLLLMVFSFMFVAKGVRFLEHHPPRLPMTPGYILIALGIAFFAFACYQLREAITFWSSQKYKPRQNYTLAQMEIHR